MRATSVLLLLLPLALAIPAATWYDAIPDGSPGNPTAREFQSFTNIPGTSLNVLFSGITYNGTTFDLPDTWILDTSVPVWKLANPPTAPTPRAYTVAGATPTEVILFGGHTEGLLIFFDDVWRYNIAANRWTQDVYTVPSVYLKRSFHAGVLVSDTLYVFGGYVAALQGSGNDLWSYNITSKNWTLLSQNGRAGSPAPRQGHSAVFFNDTTRGPSIIFFGGYNGTGGSSDTWQYVIATNSFIQLTKDSDPLGPHPRWAHSAVLLSNRSETEMLIFGGSFVGGAINPYYNDLWSLSLNGTEWQWTELIPDGNTLGPWRRGGHSTVISDGGLFTFGGYGMFVGLYNDLWQLSY